MCQRFPYIVYDFSLAERHLKNTFVLLYPIGVR